MTPDSYCEGLLLAARRDAATSCSTSMRAEPRYTTRCATTGTSRAWRGSRMGSSRWSSATGACSITRSAAGHGAVLRIHVRRVRGAGGHSCPSAPAHRLDVPPGSESPRWLWRRIRERPGLGRLTGSAQRCALLLAWAPAANALCDLEAQVPLPDAGRLGRRLLADLARRQLDAQALRAADDVQASAPCRRRAAHEPVQRIHPVHRRVVHGDDEIAGTQIGLRRPALRHRAPSLPPRASAADPSARTSRRSSGRSRPEMPRYARRTRPCVRISVSTHCAVVAGTANPMPCAWR